MEKYYKRYIRYAQYFLQWIFFEKLFGLDFSMRDKSVIREENGSRYNGYSKTDQKHIKIIFDAFNIDEQDSILDIGCGKGAALRGISEYKFGKIAGIEYDEKLSQIAKKNFKRLHMSERIQIFNLDAINFKQYEDYNYFYFFNSFSGEILVDVLARIAKDCKSGWFIYHNPVQADIVQQMSEFTKVRELYDPVKSYYTYIYRINGTDY